MTSFRKNKNILLMYGTPHGHFQISGQVQDEDSKAVEGAMVISRQFKHEDFLADKDSNFYYLSYGCDTVYTDRKGRYDLKAYSYLAGNEVETVVKDHSGQCMGESIRDLS